MKRSARATHTAYERPYRPLPLRVANTALGLAWRSVQRRPPLDETALFEIAERATGLLDPGEPDFRAPLRTLLRSIESEARLHPIGRLITRHRLATTLATRMRITERFRRDPSLADQRIGAPIVIAGLQRTGTTLLHRLLASDARRLRALASWEALDPVPPEVRENETDPRLASAEVAESGLRYMAPDFFAVHPVEARAPEEDVLLLDLSFRSTVPEATLRVPSFSRWLEDQDQLPAYRMLERCLQLLEPRTANGGKPRRWVLKTPHHLEWLDVLFSVFPDALVVWPHRDPVQTVPSFCSMVAHGRGVFSDDVDPREVGSEWSRKVARMLDRGMSAREAAGDKRFVDVAYSELVRDPISVVRRIYQRADIPYSREAESAMRDLLRTQTQHKHGVHRYDAADFGLSDDGIRNQLAAYRARFAPFFS